MPKFKQRLFVADGGWTGEFAGCCLEFGCLPIFLPEWPRPNNNRPCFMSLLINRRVEIGLASVKCRSENINCVMWDIVGGWSGGFAWFCPGFGCHWGRWREPEMKSTSISGINWTFFNAVSVQISTLREGSGMIAVLFVAYRKTLAVRRKYFNFRY